MTDFINTDVRIEFIISLSDIMLKMTDLSDIQDRIKELKDKEAELTEQKNIVLDEKIVELDSQIKELESQIKCHTHMKRKLLDEKCSVMRERYPTIWRIKCTKWKPGNSYSFNVGFFTSKEQAERFLCKNDYVLGRKYEVIKVTTENLNFYNCRINQPPDYDSD